MEPNEIQELESLKSKCLKEDGEPKARAKKADLGRLKELQAAFDNEQLVRNPSAGARMKQITLNVCGRTKIKTVPA